MGTYDSIKYAISERIDSLETMLSKYEKYNPMRNNILIRIDELNSLMRVLKIVEQSDARAKDFRNLKGE